MQARVNGTGWHSYVQGLEAAADDVRALGEHRRKLRAILDTQVRYA